jgi:hypothetical protein
MSNEQRVISRGVFDADFRYRTSIDTDIRKTFDRIRRAQAAAAKEGAKALPGIRGQGHNYSPPAKLTE